MHEKILVTGATTHLWKQLKPLIPQGIEPIELSRQQCDLSKLDSVDEHRAVIIQSNRIVLAHGILAPARFQERPPGEVIESMTTNLLSFVRIAEIALEHNPRARIIFLGSESGFKGSFDISYALSKFALHRYVEERRILHPTQQLLCLAPSIISDGGMTLKKKDQERVKKDMAENPKGRGLTSAEVAQWIHFLLFQDSSYISNVVIPIDGGKFARMK